MMKFEDACKLVGHDRRAAPPEPVYTYFAYKDGKAQEFSTLDLAKEFSKNNEKVLVNKEEIDTFWKNMAQRLELAVEEWMESLRVEYSHLSGKQFNICYNEAYDRGHHAGYDEVAMYMSDVVEFAESIIESTK
jgi:DNA repair ATPase RecN